MQRYQGELSEARWPLRKGQRARRSTLISWINYLFRRFTRVYKNNVFCVLERNNGKINFIFLLLTLRQENRYFFVTLGPHLRLKFFFFQLRNLLPWRPSWMETGSASKMTEQTEINRLYYSDQKYYLSSTD